MPIDRDELLADVVFYLGSNNLLDDARILAIAERVISGLPADDDEYYGNALCSTLRNAAIQNRALSLNQPARVKREKSYEREVEYFSDNDDSFWDDYLKSLDTLCPTFRNFTQTSSRFGGMRINVPDPIRVPCGSVDYGRTGFDGCSSKCDDES